MTLPGLVCSISCEQSEDLSSAQMAVELILSNLPRSIRTPDCHHISACDTSVNNRKPTTSTSLEWLQL